MLCTFIGDVEVLFKRVFNWFDVDVIVMLIFLLFLFIFGFIDVLFVWMWVFIVLLWCVCDGVWWNERRWWCFLVVLFLFVFMLWNDVCNGVMFVMGMLMMWMILNVFFVCFVWWWVIVCGVSVLLCCFEYFFWLEWFELVGVREDYYVLCFII